jgi:steroid delta-isomerase-like uncharacterized protein
MNKKLGVLLLTAILFGGFNQAQGQQAALITGHFNALTKHDVKAIAAGYADSAKIYSPNWEGAKTGQAGITETYNRYFASTPDLAYKVDHIINAGDQFVVEYTVSGTLSAPEAGTPDYMKNKKYRLGYCAIFETKNNKIIRETDYFDQLAFLRQVGFFDQH